MILIIASQTDLEAHNLKNSFSKMGYQTYCMFSEEIYDWKNWILKLNDQETYASVVYKDNTMIDINNVDCIICRIHKLSNAIWENNISDEYEKSYIIEEWNAFILGWLFAFGNKLQNNPTPLSLAGNNPSIWKWYKEASACGFLIEPFSLSSHKNFEQETQNHLNEIYESIIVIGNKVFCDIKLSSYKKQAYQLAKLSNNNILEIFVKKIDNHVYFSHACPIVNFTNKHQKLIKSILNEKVQTQNLLTI